MKVLSFFRITSPPVKIFFKIFYILSIICSLCLLSHDINKFHGFVFLIYCVFSVFGLFTNIFNYLFPEKVLSKWCSVFLGLNVVMSFKYCFVKDNIDTAFFLLSFLFITTLFRYFHLDREIKDFLKIKEKRAKLLNDLEGK